MATPLSAGTKLGRYEICSQLGAGRMGEVYLAQATRLDPKVALKNLLADVASKTRSDGNSRSTIILNKTLLICLPVNAAKAFCYPFSIAILAAWTSLATAGNRTILEELHYSETVDARFLHTSTRR